MTHIRRAHLEDLDALVQVHAAAFEGFMLTLLGLRFLRLLYRAFILDSSAVALVACQGDWQGKVVGFAVATSQPEGFFRRILFTDGVRFALAAVPALLRQPLRVGRRLFAGLTYRGDRPPKMTEGWLLSSIGVHPSVAGQGVGSELLEALCQIARAAGAPSIYLTTDTLDNQAAHRFYGRNGFRVVHQFVRRDRRAMTVFVRDFAG